MAHFGFCHQLLLKLSRVRGNKSKKAAFRGNFYQFQNFLVFRNFEKDFGINLKKCF